MARSMSLGTRPPYNTKKEKNLSILHLRHRYAPVARATTFLSNKELAMFHQSLVELHVVHSRFYNLTLPRSVDYQSYLLLIHFATEFLRRPKGGLKPPFTMNPGYA
ncbi:hypothetical protein ACH5RR_032026 [Cinchona calisaya]|uniref:Uncharacterized protein n=1 Tax=Cinchona calisaya TaxID=153742 RepID=A0ABD2YJK8_9GENT